MKDEEATTLHNKHSPPFTLNRASKDILFGSIAGMISKIFEHPFDLVKVRLQTQPLDSQGKPKLFSGALNCFQLTFKKEGFFGLYRGLSMPIFGATLENATLFFTYNFVQGQLRKLNGMSLTSTLTNSNSTLIEDSIKPLPMTSLAIAAAFAGASASIVLTPIEMIKCTMQVQMISKEVDILSKAVESNSNNKIIINSKTFSNLQGPFSIIKEILKRDGLKGLWVGQIGTLLRETGGGIAWFLTFESVSRKMLELKSNKNRETPLTKKDLSNLQLMLAGSLAGINYNLILFPADSIKSTMQTEREWSKSNNNKSSKSSSLGFFQTFFKIYDQRGIKGLYAGCLITCLRSAPSSALIFLLYNRLEVLADSIGI